MDYFLGIDLGTSGCRSAVFDETLRMLSIATVEIPILNLSSKEVEQNAEDWWHALVLTAQKAIAEAHIPPEKVRALSISSQSISVVPIGKDGQPLSNAISWLDTRASEQQQSLEEQYSFKDIYRLTGKRSSVIYTLPKLMWFAQERPEIYEQAYKFLLPLDYLVFRLCGAYCTDHTCASGTMYYDVQNCQWAKTLLAEQNLDEEKLPELRWSGEAVGTLSPDVAALLGLSPATVVAMGGQDQKCASYGAGLTTSNTTVSLGTAGCVESLMTKASGDSQCNIPMFAYLHPNTWVLEGILSTCGICYNWFRDILGENMSFREMDELAKEVVSQDHPVFFYPYLSGTSSPHWNETCGHFAHLSLATTKGHLCKSIMEGVAYSIRANLESMESVLHPTTTLNLFGGGAKSSVFSQIIANVTGKRVITRNQSEMALVGAAMLAMQSVGMRAATFDSKPQIYDPEHALMEKYTQTYAEYEALRQRLFNGT